MQIVTDNGREFTNTISKTLQEIHGCKLLFSAPYHPQTNGLVESTHKAIKQSLIKSLSENLWFHYLELVTFSINTPRDTTKYSAFELIQGCRKPRLTFEAEHLAFHYSDISMEENSLENDGNDDELLQFLKNEKED